MRPGGQLTLPAWVGEALELEVGDRLVVSVGEGSVTFSPRHATAPSALRAIQHAFASGGVSEEEMQEEGRKVREEMARSRNGTS